MKKHFSQSVSKRQGFSLVEVALSLAIVGVGLVSILGLMSVALDGVRDTSDDHQVAIIAHQLIADRQGTPFDVATASAIPPLNAAVANNNLYFLKDGTATPTLAGAFYRACVTIIPIPPGAAKLEIRVEWPANSMKTNVNFFNTIIARTTTS